MQQGEAGSDKAPRYETATIEPERHIFPHCLVWTPLPPITWFLPFIGHMGIADSRGMIYDFAGPYTIGKGRLAFGAPTRYIQLTLTKCSGGAHSFDCGIESGNRIYARRMHNLFCDNCHSHVARCLNTMPYGDTPHYNMIFLTFWMFLFGKYVSFISFLKTWLPFTVFISIILIVKHTAR